MENYEDLHLFRKRKITRWSLEIAGAILLLVVILFTAQASSTFGASTNQPHTHRPVFLGDRSPTPVSNSHPFSQPAVGFRNELLTANEFFICINCHQVEASLPLASQPVTVSLLERQNQPMGMGGNTATVE